MDLRLRVPDWVDDLGPYAGQAWFIIGDGLCSVEGLLANIDRMLVAQYCEAYNEFRQASKELNGQLIAKQHYSRYGKILSE